MRTRASLGLSCSRRSRICATCLGLASLALAKKKSRCSAASRFSLSSASHSPKTAAMRGALNCAHAPAALVLQTAH